MSTPGAPSSEPEAAEAHSASASLPHVAPGDAGGASPPAAALPPKHAPCSREAASWASAQAPHTAYLRIEYFTNREARALGWAAYVAAAIVKTSVVVLVCYKFQSDEAEVLFVHKTWWVHQSMLGGGLLWFCPTCHSREPHAKFEIPTNCGCHVVSWRRYIANACVAIACLLLLLTLAAWFWINLRSTREARRNWWGMGPAPLQSCIHPARAVHAHCRRRPAKQQQPGPYRHLSVSTPNPTLEPTFCLWLPT